MSKKRPRPGRPRQKTGQRPELAQLIIDLRLKLGETTAEFGDRFFRGGRTVEEWEQSRREPDELVKQMIYDLADENGIE